MKNITSQKLKEYYQMKEKLQYIKTLKLSAEINRKCR
jgi:hypothetical protein